MNRIAQITAQPINVYKTEAVSKTLYRFTGTGGRTLSPSALNEFLNCPLRFYFHHIAGLPQPDEIAEEVDPRIFGNVLHKAIRHIYGTLGSGEINPEMLENILHHEDEVDKSLDKAFNEEFFGVPEGTPRKIEGINLVIRQVIRKYLLNLIRADKPVRSGTVGLERRFITTVDAHR
jgi:ATP-dependent helicase/DNAse subunit B